MIVTNAEKLVTAFTIAFDAHEGQKRDDGTPYIKHPMRVMKVLVDEFGIHDVNTLCAAMLHDVVEDTDVSYEELIAKVGVEVELMVKILTKTGLTKEQYFSNLSQASENIKLIKIADRMDNLRDMKGWTEKRKQKYIAETKQYLVPIAAGIHKIILDKLEKVVAAAESNQNNTK